MRSTGCVVFGDLTLLGLDQVAYELDAPRSRVERLVRNDELAGVIHGGRWMVAAEEVERFKASWTPPVRVSRVGSTRRFRPPSPPAAPA